MAEPSIPPILRVWLLFTRCFAIPIRLVSRFLHGRMGSEPERFSERLGQVAEQPEGNTVWFHAASLGEVAQIRPLAERLRQSEQTKILVTTTTQAGAEWVMRELPYAIHRFAPIDTPHAVESFLGSWHISLAVFIEGDLWPRLIMGLQQRNIPHVLLNARHSRTRERLPSLFTKLLSEFSLITCRSDQVAQDIKSIGFPVNQLKVLPDLRIATANLPCPPDIMGEMADMIGDRKIWLAASTHPADEEAIFNAHKDLLAKSPDSLLVLAPRHPKRGDPLTIEARSRGFNLARRSAGEPLTPETQIYLADTLGELGVFFSLAPIAFLGGSYGTEGGHNPYEPASFETAILSGPKVQNFEEAYSKLEKVGAAEFVENPAELGDSLFALMQSGQIGSMAKAGQEFMKDSKDSVATSVQLLRDIMRGRNTSS